MSIFDKIKQKQDNTVNAIEGANDMTNVITFQKGDKIITVFNIKRERKVQYNDGTVNDLMSAQVTINNIKGAVILKYGMPICFEVPEGRRDLIRSILMQREIPQLSPENYTYVGKASDGGAINNQDLNDNILNVINKMNQELLAERKRQYKKYNEQAKRRIVEAREKEQEIISASEDRKKDELKEKRNRIKSPFLKGEISHDRTEQYNGVNLENGEILRIRNVRKVGKDLANTYLYSAVINSTPHESDVEVLDDAMGIPVVFTLPYRMNDIVNSNYNSENKQRLVEGILQMFTDGYSSLKDSDKANDIAEALYDIGGVDLEGRNIQNKEGQVSRVIIDKINELKYEFENQHKGKEKERRRETVK